MTREMEEYVRILRNCRDDACYDAVYNFLKLQIGDTQRRLEGASLTDVPLLQGKVQAYRALLQAMSGQRA